jgi:hypothetical protein
MLKLKLVDQKIDELIKKGREDLVVVRISLCGWKDFCPYSEGINLYWYVSESLESP